jgi:hypothetical protein
VRNSPLRLQNFKLYPIVKDNKFSFKNLKYESHLSKKKIKDKVNQNIEIGNIDFKISYNMEFNFNDSSIDKLIDNLNKNIKNNTFMNDIAVIENDHLGFKLDKIISCSWSDLKYKPFDSQFKQPVLYYNYTEKKIQIYYNAKYLNLIGYKDSSGRHNEYLGANIYVKKLPNLKDILLNLGHTKDIYNIKNHIYEYFKNNKPLMSIDEINMLLLDSKTISSDIEKSIKYSLERINSQRIDNIKKIINNIRIQINQLVNKLKMVINIIPELSSKRKTLEDEYEPNISSKILIKNYIDKSKDFKIKNDSIFKNCEYLPTDFTSDTPINKLELTIPKEQIKLNNNLINYLAEELYSFIKINESSNDNLKSFINNFIVDTLKDQYFLLFNQHTTINTFFDKQLIAINYKAPYDKKITSDTLIEPVTEILDENKDEGELDANLDEDLTALIEDIDQEEGNFDIDDDY